MAAIDVTTNIGCKNACIYCAQDKIIQAYRKRSDVTMMNYETFKTCLDKIPSSVRIHFAGLSECWLNPDCTKMIVHAHEQGYTIVVLTTLVGLDPADVDLIERFPFVSFTIHLPSNEGYENIRVDENYLKTLERISNSAIKVCYMNVIGSVHKEVKSLLGDKIDSSFAKAKPFFEAMTLAGNAAMKIRPKFKKMGIIDCAWKLSLNTLLPNGEVSLCCVDFGLQHVFGNLMVSDYDSIFRGREFLEVKRGLHDSSLDTLCRYCERAVNVNMFAKIYNPAARYISEPQSIFRDSFHNFQRGARFLRSFLYRNFGRSNCAMSKEKERKT